MIPTTTNMIKYSAITGIIKDSTAFPLAQIFYLNRPVACSVLWPYGFGGVAPIDSLAVTFNIQGHEENQTCIATTPELRPTDLVEGETYFGNLLTKTIQFNRSNGDLERRVAHDAIDDIKGSVKSKIASKLSVTIGDEITLDVGKGATIDIGSGVTLKIKGDITLRVDGKISLISDSINLGEGGAAVARVGDSVLVDGKTGTITSGSSTTKST